MVDYKKKLCWYKYGKISIFMSFCGRTKLPFMMQHFTCNHITFLYTETNAPVCDTLITSSENFTVYATVMKLSYTAQNN